MAGIYLHIPFCRKVCSYCDFYKSTMISMIPDFQRAIFIELEDRKAYLKNETIDTIYFGGGTPSLLPTFQVNRIIKHIKDLYLLGDNCEITLEANPDDLSREYLLELAQTSVNRLSIGVQSLNDRDLQLLNRRHNASQALASIEHAREAGFKNISIDLIYGIPGMTVEDWQRNLETIPDVEHISAYHLTVEPGTALFRKVTGGLLSIASDDESSAMFFMLRQFGAEKNLVHYEISNLAREGFFSRHNTAYWQRKKYLGAGPSAHSYDLASRQWNIRDVRKYTEAISSGGCYFEREDLDKKDHFNEYLMVSLRTIWGVDEKTLLDAFGEVNYAHFRRKAAPFFNTGHLVQEGSVFRMTANGWLISDHILSRLII